MADAAVLSVEINSQPMVAGAARAERSLDDLRRSARSLSGGVDRLENGLTQTTQGMRRSAAASRTLERSINPLASGFGRLQNSLGGLSSTLAAFGVTMAAGFGLTSAIKTIATFDQSMSQLGAVTQATTKDLAAMEEQAKDLGATTSFSASQAAEGMKFLGQAGFDTSQIIATMPDMLNLATAGFLDLGRTADITSNIMGGFGINAEDIRHTTDVLVTAINSANTTVEELGDAFKFAGTTAKGIGISFEETAAAIGVLSDGSLKAGEAGTGLRRVLFQLIKPGKESQAVLDKLQITQADLDFKTRSLSDVMNTFKEASIGTKDALIVFGAEGKNAFDLLSAGSSKLETLTQKMNDAEGIAEKTADQMENNIPKAVAGFTSSLDKLILKLGDAGAKGAMRSFVDTSTEMVRAISDPKVFDPLIDGLSRLTKIVVIGGALYLGLTNLPLLLLKTGEAVGVLQLALSGLTVAGGTAFGVTFANNVQAIGALGVTSSAAALGVAALSVAIKGVVVAWIGWEIGSWLRDIDLVKNAIDKITRVSDFGAIIGEVGDLREEMHGLAFDLAEFDRLNRQALKGGALEEGFFQLFAGNAVKMRADLKGTAAGLREMGDAALRLKDNLTPEQVADVTREFDRMTIILATAGMTDLAGQASQYAQSLRDVSKDADSAADGIDKTKKAMDKATASTDATAGAVDGLSDAMANLPDIAPKLNALGIARRDIESFLADQRQQQSLLRIEDPRDRFVAAKSSGLSEKAQLAGQNDALREAIGLTYDLQQADIARITTNRKSEADRADALKSFSRASDASDKIQQKRIDGMLDAEKDAAKKREELIRQPFENAMADIQSTFTDAFENIFTGGVDSFEDLGDEIIKIMGRMAANVATMMIFNPEVSFTDAMGGVAPGLFGSASGGDAAGILGTGISGADVTGIITAITVGMELFNRQLSPTGIIFGREEKLPEVTLGMGPDVKEFWEDFISAQGSFGSIGLVGEESRHISTERTQSLQVFFDNLAAADTAMAGFLTPDQIDQIREHMDRWQSSIRGGVDDLTAMAEERAKEISSFIESQGFELIDPEEVRRDRSRAIEQQQRNWQTEEDARQRATEGVNNLSKSFERLISTEGVTGFNLEILKLGQWFSDQQEKLRGLASQGADTGNAENLLTEAYQFRERIIRGGMIDSFKELGSALDETAFSVEGFSQKYQIEINDAETFLTGFFEWLQGDANEVADTLIDLSVRIGVPLEQIMLDIRGVVEIADEQAEKLAEANDKLKEEADKFTDNMISAFDGFVDSVEDVSQRIAKFSAVNIGGQSQSGFIQEQRAEFSTKPSKDPAKWTPEQMTEGTQLYVEWLDAVFEEQSKILTEWERVDDQARRVIADGRSIGDDLVSTIQDVPVLLGGTISEVDDYITAMSVWVDHSRNVRRTALDLSRQISSARGALESELNPQTLAGLDLQISTRKTALLSAASPEAGIDQAQELFDLVMERYEMEKDQIADVSKLYNGIGSTIKAANQTFWDIQLNKDISPLTNQERVSAAQERFGQLKTAAQTGDPEAVREFLNFTGPFLEEMRGYFATSDDFVNIWEDVKLDIDSFTSASGFAIATEGETLTSIEDSTTRAADTLEFIQSASDQLAVSLTDNAKHQAGVMEDNLGVGGPIEKGITGVSTAIDGLAAEIIEMVRVLGGYVDVISGIAPTLGVGESITSGGVTYEGPNAQEQAAQIDALAVQYRDPTLTPSTSTALQQQTQSPAVSSPTLNTTAQISTPVPVDIGSVESSVQPATSSGIDLTTQAWKDLDIIFTRHDGLEKMIFDGDMDGKMWRSTDFQEWFNDNKGDSTKITAQQAMDFPTLIWALDAVGYERGTNFVPQDGLAFLHEGEAVIPAGTAEVWRDEGMSGGSEDSKKIVIELQGLRREVAANNEKLLEAQRMIWEATGIVGENVEASGNEIALVIQTGNEAEARR